MRRMLAILFLLLLAPAAFAGKPTEKQIDELIEVTRAQALLEGSLAQVESSQREMLAQLVASEGMSQEQQAALEGMVAKLSKSLREAMTWDKMRPMYHRIYSASFDAEDVDAMVAFYRTPVGQRLIERMPTVMQHTMAEIQGLMVPALQKFQQEVAVEVAAKRDAGAQ